ncbi:hypothetical protein F4804DRAFT_194226 [Jackrogersella minutella]|nr:hypothetical protein F4804DRAFT_194226 [Jackrogersella minutella]
MRSLPISEDMADEETDVVASAVDLAAAHGKDIAERYGVRGDIIRNLSDESIRIFGAIGSQWHQLLGLDSKKPPRSGKHHQVLSYGTPPASLTSMRSRSLLGRPQPVVFLPPLTSPSQTGLLTPIGSNASEYGPSGSGPMVFPSRRRSEVPTTSVLVYYPRNTAAAVCGIYTMLLSRPVIRYLLVADYHHHTKNNRRNNRLSFNQLYRNEQCYIRLTGIGVTVISMFAP